MNPLPLLPPAAARSRTPHRSRALVAVAALLSVVALPALPAQTAGAQTSGAQTSGTETSGTETSGSQATPAPGSTAQTPAPDSSLPGSQTSATPPPPAAGVVDSAHYIIGPDDMLQITVWREPTLSGALPVRPDGMISLVLIGDLKAAGRTPAQLGADITQRLRRYLQDPVVSVAVTADNSQRVFLVGEVGKVGPISLTPGMTPLQAISSAGGPTPYANTKHIYILRGTGARQQKIPFNYKQALKGDSRQSPVLQPGDTIIVP